MKPELRIKDTVGLDLCGKMNEGALPTPHTRANRHHLTPMIDIEAKIPLMDINVYHKIPGRPTMASQSPTHILLSPDTGSSKTQLYNLQRIFYKNMSDALVSCYSAPPVLSYFRKPDCSPILSPVFRQA